MQPVILAAAAGTALGKATSILVSYGPWALEKYKYLKKLYIGESEIATAGEMWYIQPSYEWMKNPSLLAGKTIYYKANCPLEANVSRHIAVDVDFLLWAETKLYNDNKDKDKEEP